MQNYINCCEYELYELKYYTNNRNESDIANKNNNKIVKTVAQTVDVELCMSLF